MPSTTSRRAHRRRRALAAALLGASAALALPAAAAADSIVYIDQGNVWSSRPDGSGKVQLTDGGSWHSPTQADDGTIAAVQGEGPIQVLARDGRPLRRIVTPPAKSADGGTFAPRPVELSFSPDGTKIAYAYVAYSCPVASSCGTIQTSTFYTRADVTEATPHAEWGNQFGSHNPEWVTNERTLVFGGYGLQVAIDDLGPGDYSQRAWIKPGADMGDGEVSRDGRRLATTFGYGPATTIALFSVNGDVRSQTPPPAPDVACELTPADERIGDPSWSPDGSALAFHTRSGVEVLRFAEFGPGRCSTAGESAVLSASGSTPDWGPADPPVARWTPPPAPPAPPSPAPPAPPRRGTPPPSGTPGARVVVKLAPLPATTRTALRKGLRLRVTTSAPGRVTALLRAGRRTLARGSATAKRAGAVTVRLSKPSARALRRLRGKRLRLTVTGSASGRAAGTLTRTVKLR